ncbi:hypothetical protein CEXT_556341 [Caerostris extrusa]|uniref:Uncharacterized protein n=1 Tax=Caerostris extrusa TaxID=172846 RepID=A0AAV4WYW5_CAEEX|nr:hypothetical protein CEXT_556341 [Caerostris extrusa]
MWPHGITKKDSLLSHTHPTVDEITLSHGVNRYSSPAMSRWYVSEIEIGVEQDCHCGVTFLWMGLPSSVTCCSLWKSTFATVDASKVSDEHQEKFRPRSFFRLHHKKTNHIETGGTL